MIHAQLTMRACSLNMDTKVEVLIPEDRNKTVDTRGKKYPVLYVLHGGKEDCSSWINQSNLFLLCRDLDLIVVFPSANNSSYIDMEYGQPYLTWIAEELPTKLKNLFPITDDPNQTFIMGESMGGYGTMRLALSHPENYGKAVCLSGGNLATSTWYTNLTPHNKGAFGFDQQAILTSDNNLEVLIDKLANKDVAKPQFMFYCGTEDNAMVGSKEVAGLVKEKLPECYAGEEYWKGKHNFYFWNQANYKALKFFGFEVEESSII